MAFRIAFLAALLVAAPVVAAAPADPGAAPPPPIKTGRAHACGSYYPPLAVRLGLEGETVLAFTVTSEGGVKDITVAISSGHPELDAAAVDCATHWRYKPATQDGAAVATPWKAAVVWKLRDPLDLQLTAVCARYHPLTGRTFAGIDGATHVTFHLRPDGNAETIAVAKSSGDASLDNAAVKCLNEVPFDTKKMAVPEQGADLAAVLDWRAEYLRRATVPLAADVEPPLLLSRTPCNREPIPGYLLPIRGPTMLQFLIATDGSVQQARVLKSSGTALLDDRAVSCVAGWHYAPARKDGAPTAIEWRGDIDWHEP
ncbi:MAG: TonB family protein [Alphaproteobacteria bacterium]|nr:TonB family protein [Alphaproteobacteria bacterium]